MESTPALSLVNAALATNAPRAIHCLVASVSLTSGSTVTSRVIHNLQRVVETVSPFSRAEWLDAELVFVPTPIAACHILYLTASFCPDDATPTSVEAMHSLPTCSFQISGSSDSSPAVYTLPLVFAKSRTSQLIKPAPVEMKRTGFAFHVLFTPTGGAVLDAANTSPALQVFLRGTLQVGGAN